ncbi:MULTISPECIES: hypothetical protein [Nocardia]|uniref:hypothetical protein n=1 Tax=Nocardia TaxID=1817 RepID=UPI000D694478|nr:MULTISPECIES: hypothetical protein [Nocardia]
MDYNYPHIRTVYEHLLTHPDEHDQGTWAKCVAGHAVRLSGSDWTLVRDSRKHVDGSEVTNMRTGELRDIEDVAAELLGMDITQARGLFATDNRIAVDWLGDILAAHETIVLDQLAKEWAS